MEGDFLLGICSLQYTCRANSFSNRCCQRCIRSSRGISGAHPQARRERTPCRNSRESLLSWLMVSVLRLMLRHTPVYRLFQCRDKHNAQMCRKCVEPMEGFCSAAYLRLAWDSKGRISVATLSSTPLINLCACSAPYFFARLTYSFTTTL